MKPTHHIFFVLLLALLFSALSLCGATEHYVRPTESTDTSCPGQPCLTLSQYISESIHFFKSNTVFKFLSGTHRVNASVMVRNVHNISLLAEGRAQPQVITYCPSNCSSNFESGNCPPDVLFCLFSFQNAINVTIDGLHIVVYPQSILDSRLSIVRIGLGFTNIFTLYFKYNRVWAVNSSFPCDINVLDSQFVEISSLDVTHGEIHLTNSENVNITNVSIVSCYHCIYMFSTNNTVLHKAIIMSASTGIVASSSNYTTINNTIIVTTVDKTTTTVVGDHEEYAIFLILSRNIKIENTTLVYNGLYLSLAANMVIVNVKVLHTFTFDDSVIANLNNLTAVNSASCIIKFRMYQITNTTINSIVMTSGEIYGREMGIVIRKSSNITISASVFKLISASFLSIIDTGRQPAVVQLQDCRNINICNCTFLENNITALKLVKTHIKVIGTLNFTSNRAYRGAAMVLIDDSSMTLSNSSFVTYTNNTADDTGGAIYIANNYFYSIIPKPSLVDMRERYEVETITSQTCFLEFESKLARSQLIFTNNSAGRGGEVLYGGILGSACVHSTEDCGSCLRNFNKKSHITPNSWSKISSDPSRVCFCDEKGTTLLTVFYPTTYFIYPGQSVVISVAVIGHNFGTVAGSVFAHFQHPVQLEAGQFIQEVQQHHCNNLTYTIFPLSKDKQILLTLTAVESDVREFQYTRESIERLLEEYRNGARHNMQDILELPIYVDINILPCPPGFELTHNPLKCGCKKQLQLLSGVACNIQYMTIQRRRLVWIGPFTDSNNAVIDVTSAQNCPLNYCKDEVVSITLNQSDTQCNYNHSGTLCGGCQPGLSLALGSPQCLKCSNKYLALLLPLTLAGLMLVFFIKTLDITTSKGFINGLIFYANILKPNEHIFLHQTNINPLTLFITWLNLDLGIETCFVDGLTAYWKTWLQFVFPFYIWVIAGLIIISARYSTRLARLMGNNSVPVLATLFLLSYAKLLRTIISILSYTVVETPHGQKTVWSADGNIDYMGPKHGCLFVAAIAALVFLWLPYTLLLLLGQWLRKINHQCVTRTLMRMKPFLDAHYGPLKDKHHYWFGVLLCTRVIILLISAVVPVNNFSVFTLSMSITAGALISVTSIGPAVYRNNIVSTFEISLFINLGLLSLTKFYTIRAEGDQAAATYTLIAIAFIQFLGLVLYQIYSLLKPLFSHCRTHAHHDDDDEATENIWRYNTSVELSLPKWKTLDSETPYQDAATTL